MITKETILRIVCNEFQVNEMDIKSNSRKREFVIPRQVYIYLAYKNTGENTTKVGESVNRDHSTVLHACKQISNVIECNHEKELIETIAKIQKLIDKDKAMFKNTESLIPTNLDLLKLI